MEVAETVAVGLGDYEFEGCGAGAVGEEGGADGDEVVLDQVDVEALEVGLVVVVGGEEREGGSTS